MLRSRGTIFTLVLMGYGGCASDDLPGPPVNTVEVVPQGSGGGRWRGIAEGYLTRHKPSHTFWNDPKTRKDAWGTITLRRVERDGLVVVDFSGIELRARPGCVFPGTGIKVITSSAELGTALLRTRWTHTQVEEVPKQRLPASATAPSSR